MHSQAFVPLSRLLTVILTIVSVLGSLRAQTNPETRATTLGGRFESLRPEQRELVQRWVAEYNRINRGRLTAVKAYSDLPPSYKTTFDAVTNALLATNLTDEQGKPLGTALGLVELVEAIHGKIPEERGDHQFRLYVLLKKDALDKLQAAREFKRIGDNTVFHKGYPINFRQQGGAPSVQFSVARTGRRADIDVDYRSSAVYAALFNGHLTAANSDVRAGNNYDRHVGRWRGLVNWWRLLFDRLFIEQLSSNETTTLNASDTPRVDGSKEVQEAIKDFFESWLVRQNPLDASSYFSVSSYPCIVEFQDGSQADSPLARARIVKQMRDVNATLGRVSNLANAIEEVALQAPGAKPVNHPYGQLFALEQLSDEAAYNLDCRVRLKLKLAEDIPRPGKGFSNYYGAMLRLKSPQYSSMNLFQVWSKEGKDWKLVSWHFDHPFNDSDRPPIVSAPAPAASKTPVAADEEIARQTRQFMVELLLNRDVDKALGHLTPDALECAAESLEIVASREREHRKRVHDLFTQIAKEAGKGKSLEDLLVAPDISHEHMQPLIHSESKAYALARISDDLSIMFQCGKRLAGTKFGKEHAQGVPTFTRGHYATVFQLRRAGEHPAALKLIWERQGNDWKVIALDIISH